MKLKHTPLYAAMITAMIGFAGCSAEDTTTASTTSTVTGPITGFGSVYVDGVEYETDDADIIIDGVPATEQDLQIGMIVTLEGSDDGSTGDAVNIEFNDNLEGIVEFNDDVNGLVIMGHTITTNADTNFEGGYTDVTDIQVGDIVEVSGYPDGNGSILATLIEKEANDISEVDEVEVKGVIVAGSLTDTTFMIGSMTVDYSNAVVDSDVALAEGLYVEVKSTDGFDPASGNLIASKVELENGGEYGVHGDEGDEIEIEGVVGEITDSTIEVNGVVYDIPEGVDLGQINSGDVIDLEFEIDDNGEPVVHEVEVEDHGSEHESGIEIEANVDAVDGDVVTVAGIEITVIHGDTVIVDHAGEMPIQYFSTADLGTGDRVEIHFYFDETESTWIATKLERVNASDSTYVELEGPVTIDETSDAVSIAGITLDFSGLNAAPTLQAGMEISVTGTVSSGTLAVTTIELDD